MFAIRAEEEADHARVFEIEAAAFGRRNEARLVEILRGSAHPHLSLVAEEGERIVGHVFFSPVDIESSESPRSVAALAPVAVDPAHQRRGIGAALIRTGLDACPARGWQAVFLIGNPLYYSRFGFVLASPLGFTYGKQVFDAVLQVYQLRSGVLSGCRGRVRYHAAFVQTGCG